MDLSNHRTLIAITAKAPPRPVFTFICTACETVRIAPEPDLPEGWEVEAIGHSEFAFCRDCSIDLPLDDQDREADQ